jgi:hypothetical protein
VPLADQLSGLGQGVGPLRIDLSDTLPRLVVRGCQFEQLAIQLAGLAPLVLPERAFRHLPRELHGQLQGGHQQLPGFGVFRPFQQRTFQSYARLLGVRQTLVHAPGQLGLGREVPAQRQVGVELTWRGSHDRALTDPLHAFGKLLHAGQPIIRSGFPGPLHHIVPGRIQSGHQRRRRAARAFR